LFDGRSKNLPDVSIKTLIKVPQLYIINHI
jgi:hypothetical protein